MLQVQAYLFFEGRCEEALSFYGQALGAEVTALMRYRDGPPPEANAQGCSPMPPDKVMHANFRIGQTQLMASDGMVQGPAKFQGFALTLSPETDAEAQRLLSALAEGGQVQQPLIATFFASSFGMVTDRFGVQWMVVVPLPAPA